MAISKYPMTEKDKFFKFVNAENENDVIYCKYTVVPNAKCKHYYMDIYTVLKEDDGSMYIVDTKLRRLVILTDSKRKIRFRYNMYVEEI